MSAILLYFLNLLQNFFWIRKKKLIKRGIRLFHVNLFWKGVEAAWGVGTWDYFRSLPPTPFACPDLHFLVRPSLLLPSRPWALCLNLGYLSSFPVIDNLFWSRISRLTSAFPSRAQLWDLPQPSCLFPLPHIRLCIQWVTGWALPISPSGAGAGWN